ncbi:uncharacterized protein RCC_02155 [Ramularia collo-cygni]|uniref:Uncharacterized protein n=1 Tax=Ramularia collo-cygni TaxID=112498 RepID=A0A2D3V7H9_9PEZI|nr:uncharacterized protein RCC_02155 [Ramularia collo-cygni]CZT16313.1 uncharacterized protein RCC_02155 [Ramularia collo-cygni]
MSPSTKPCGDGVDGKGRKWDGLVRDPKTGKPLYWAMNGPESDNKAPPVDDDDDDDDKNGKEKKHYRGAVKIDPALKKNKQKRKRATSSSRDQASEQSRKLQRAKSDGSQRAKSDGIQRVKSDGSLDGKTVGAAANELRVAQGMKPRGRPKKSKSELEMEVTISPDPDAAMEDSGNQEVAGEMGSADQPEGPSYFDGPRSALPLADNFGEESSQPSHASQAPLSWADTIVVRPSQPSRIGWAPLASAGNYGEGPSQPPRARQKGEPTVGGQRNLEREQKGKPKRGRPLGVKNKPRMPKPPPDGGKDDPGNGEGAGGIT